MGTGSIDAGSDESSFSEASDEDRGEAEVPYLI